MKIVSNPQKIKGFYFDENLKLSQPRARFNIT